MSRGSRDGRARSRVDLHRVSRRLRRVRPDFHRGAGVAPACPPTANSLGQLVESITEFLHELPSDLELFFNHVTIGSEREASGLFFNVDFSTLFLLYAS